MVDSILNWFSTNLQKLMDFFKSVFDFFVHLLDSFGDFVCDIFVKFYQYVLDNIASTLDSIAESVPDVSSYLNSNYSTASQAFYFANRLFALDVGFALMISFLTFVVGFIGFKFLLKIIPTIG